MNTRRILLELFDAALRAVDGRVVVERELRSFATAPYVVFAVGKAASAMARGALAALGDHVARVLVVTKDGHVDPELVRHARVQILESAHPVPDERSLAAGAELERQVLGMGPGEIPIFLISGGGSSLVEALHEGATLADLRALNERGLAAGWGIATLNAERTRLSRLKGGGVTRLLAGRDAFAFFISDVPNDDPAVIASGLLGPRPGITDNVTRRVIANVELAAHAAREAARARGLDVDTRPARFAGEASAVAAEFVEALRDTAADGLVWGGESTVALPAQPGRGGRNTHLALHAARLLRPDEKFLILAAGTDGTDGPTADAGAMVDSQTFERAELAGVDVERALAHFDSGTALEAAEDLVHTGPTGTNVGDILIGLKGSATRVRGLSPDPVL